MRRGDCVPRRCAAADTGAIDRRAGRPAQAQAAQTGRRPPHERPPGRLPCSSGSRPAAVCRSWDGWKAHWPRRQICAAWARCLPICIDRPEWVAELLDICTELAIAFARSQIVAGADIIGLGDAVASQIAPRALSPLRAALRAANTRCGARDGRDPAAAHLRQHHADPDRHGRRAAPRSSISIGWWTCSRRPRHSATVRPSAATSIRWR